MSNSKGSRTVYFDEFSELKKHADEMGLEVEIAIEDLEYSHKALLENAYQILELEGKLDRKEELKIQYSLLNAYFLTKREGSYIIGQSASLDNIIYWDLDIWSTDDKLVLYKFLEEESDEEEEITLGDYIKRVLFNEGWSIGWLAREIGMEEEKLEDYLENGTLLATDLIKISKVIDVDLYDLRRELDL